MLTQFEVYLFKNHPVLVLTNTTFHEIEQILVAPVKPQEGEKLIRRLQIPVTLHCESHFIDLMDMATVFSHQIAKKPILDLGHLRHEIKSGLDFLIDGF